MVKRIIFDIDNTLIDWKEEYWNSLRYALDNYKIKYNQKDLVNLKLSVDNFEKEYDMYKKEYMIKCMNKYTNLNLKNRFIDLWIDELSKCVPDKIDENEIETLNYLSKKYELVTLSNWYYKSQYNRMVKTNIAKYFIKIYAPEDFKIKPYKEAFLNASDNRIDDTIMVGDDLNIDINGALNAGMKVIFLNRKNIDIKDNSFQIINKIDELKNIL